LSFSSTKLATYAKKQLPVLKTFVLDNQHKQEDVEHMKLDPNANFVPTTLREEDDEQC
jgi:hypothetical protein